MVCSTRKVIELSVKSLLFLILLFLYYYFYMYNALSQYFEERTMMAESIKPDNQHDYPVLIFCPQPGFKPSFFDKIKRTTEALYIEKYIWKRAWQKKILLENVSSIPDVYENMSNKLEKNWKILLQPYSVLDSMKRY